MSSITMKQDKKEAMDINLNKTLLINSGSEAQPIASN